MGFYTSSPREYKCVSASSAVCIDEILLATSRLSAEDSRSEVPIFSQDCLTDLNCQGQQLHVGDDSKQSECYEYLAHPSHDCFFEVFDELPFTIKSSQDDCLNFVRFSKLFHPSPFPERARRNFQIGLALTLEELRCAKAAASLAPVPPCASMLPRE